MHVPVHTTHGKRMRRWEMAGTVGVFWYARQAFLEHAAGAARPVQSRDTLVWDNIDLQMEVFEK